MAGTTRAVFLSYRREETRHIAGRLAERLTERLGSTQVFMDVNTIEPGADFAAAIAREIALCHVLIALIGPTWLTIVDRQGRRRLDDPDDFVVLEIQAALERGIHVIPVLIDGAAMPDRDDLPEGLQGLARRNTARLDHETFLSDVTVLLNAVDRILATLTQKATEPTVNTGTAVADRAIIHNKEHPEQASRANNPGVLFAGQRDVASTQHPPLSVPPLIPSWPLPWLRLRPRLLITVIVMTMIVAGGIALLATNDSPPMVPTGGGPSGVAITPDGRHAYITNRNANSVSVIDTGTR